MENKFLTNYSNITFLNKIKDSLKTCKEFYFSVSFIKKAGLILIEDDIKEALDRGCRGVIITSTYQNFTDIESLKTFCNWKKEYKNFSAHLDFNSFGDNGFHSKGYIFVYDNKKEVIIGSSNITRFALLKNIEWNVSISATDDNLFVDSKNEFDYLYAKTYELDEGIIKKYSYQLMYAIEKWDMDYYEGDNTNIKPNLMQRKALKELIRNRDLGVKRSLLISATGSGKTYLAAFDARNYDAKRLLYIVHKESILVDALNTFKKIFGAKRTYGLYTGSRADLGCDFIFSTNIMMSSHLDMFREDEFDYIVMDECHHATSTSYSSIMSYFKPGFYLGLTATPERMDKEDVFGLFENNVPFELRLRDAIINDLIVPFHYYAIKDVFVDYSNQDKGKIAKEIARQTNVEFISSQIKKYKKDNEKLKCVAFCVSKDHARLMAEEFRLEGYNAVCLTGDNDTGSRFKEFHNLEDETNPLEIICSVDILNEGVDIPSINMVLFLRPTESSTIFLQQLGRGLRKYPGKDYLTVLDFIGNNYDRATHIALALGTLSKSSYTEKEYLKDLVRTDFKSLQINGLEISFDDLSKTEIITHLDNTNFNRIDFLKKDFINFAKYLKKECPTHMDFLDSEIAPDLMRFMKSMTSGKKNRSYYTFLKKIGYEDLPLFSDSQVEFIDNVSDLLPLVRVDEYLIIKELLDDNLDLERLINYNSKVNINTLNHALKILNNKKILINNKLNVDLINDEFKTYMIDLILYGINRYNIEFKDYEGLFRLYGNYYKEQIQLIRLKDSLMYMKGTEFDLNTNETYCYVGLKKDASIDDRLRYKDKFIDANTFQWESEVNTTLDNSIGKKILNTKVVHLFIRKIEKEDNIILPFTYFGTGRFDDIRESNTIENGVCHKTLLTDIILDNKVPEEYYLDYGIKDIEIN